MRKLEPKRKDAIKFIGGIIDSLHKRKAEHGLPDGEQFKSKCRTIINANAGYIKGYDESLKKGDVKGLCARHPKLQKEEADKVRSLYQSKRKSLITLRDEILGRNQYCPICGINLVDTFDHFVPQKEYPLFAVHPSNLIPSCMDCNDSKSSNVLDGDKRMFWNAYFDTPPKDEYLFCKVIEGDDMPDVSFSLKQGDIDDETFRLIRNTMNKEGQNVFERFQKASGRFIEELLNQTRKHIHNNPTKSFAECIDDVKKSVDECFENNEAQWVVKKAMIDSPIFTEWVKKEMEEDLS